MVNVTKFGTVPTPTYDGSGQTVHPSVIDFVDQFGAAWNGWRYWMAVTPYPGGDESFENPSILVSADGTTWQEPAGISNPIAPLPVGANNQGDPCIVYDGAATLHLYYLLKGDSGFDAQIMHRSSTDGITWSAATAQFQSNTESLTSPAVVFDGATWWLWYGDESAPSPTPLRLFQSANPTGPWSSIGNVTATNLPTNKEFDHQFIFLKDGSFYIYASVADLGTSATGSSMVAGRSIDGLAFELTDILIAPSLNDSDFDEQLVYHGSGWLTDDNTYRLWYSGMHRVGAGTQTWRTGYAEITDLWFDFEDDFIGTDDDPWDTDRWNQDGPGGGSTVIDTNQGKASGATGNANSGGRGRGKQGQVPNQELTGTFQLCETDEPCNGALWLQTSDDWSGLDWPTEGYGVRLPSDSDTATLLRASGGVVTELDSTVWPRDTGLKRFRFRRQGPNVRFSVWDDGDPEPPLWMLTAEDSVVTPDEPGAFQVSYTCPTAPSVDSCATFDDVVVDNDDSPIGAAPAGATTCEFDSAFSSAFANPDTCVTPPEPSPGDRIGGTGAIRRSAAAVRRGRRG